MIELLRPLAGATPAATAAAPGIASPVVAGAPLVDEAPEAAAPVVDFAALLEPASVPEPSPVVESETEADVAALSLPAEAETDLMTDVPDLDGEAALAAVALVAPPLASAPLLGAMRAALGGDAEPASGAVIEGELPASPAVVAAWPDAVDMVMPEAAMAMGSAVTLTEAVAPQSVTPVLVAPVDAARGAQASAAMRGRDAAPVATAAPEMPARAAVEPAADGAPEVAADAPESFAQHLKAADATRPDAQPSGVTPRAETRAAREAAMTRREELTPLTRNVLDRMQSLELAEGVTRITLRPRGLGAPEFDVLHMADGRLRLAIRAENPMILEALRAEGGALGQFMGERGFDLAGGQPEFGEWATPEAEDAMEGAEAEAEPEQQAAAPIARGLTDIIT